jgi:NAD(P)-dependent dehydrogenase (short-subunit alcohol dehydrogenase family)
MASNISRALVVGGTGGIGHAIACRVAADAASSTVIISGRTKPETLAHANMEFRQLDALSMRAVKAYADAYKAAQEPPIDLLVLSQGIASLAGRTETPEGIDRKMALHLYGRQLLVRELMPALSRDATVLIVLDSLGGAPQRLNWDDLDLKTTFSLTGAATHCITMTDAMVQHYALEQQARGQGESRHFVHASPGVVNTNIARGMPWYLRAPSRAVFSLFGTSPEASAQFLVKGTYANRAADEKDGRFYSYIDRKGDPVSGKAVWSDEQRQTVVDHVWKIVDEALAKEG